MFLVFHFNPAGDSQNEGTPFQSTNHEDYYN